MKKALKFLALCVVVGGVAVGAQEAKAPIVQSVTKNTVSVLFVGDIMLDRSVARAAAARGTASLTEGLESLFSGEDLRVANLEGTITASTSVAQKDSGILRFTFAPALTQEVLHSLDLSAVSLANNHTLDFSPAGYDETRANLERFGVAAFGHPFNAPGLLSTSLSVRGKNICLVGYMELFKNDPTPVVQEIQRLKASCWRTVVFAHWGVEYTATSTPQQQAEAHQFVDAGADLVVGAHPHVVEEVEVYRGRAIFYSLGNFIFDQNFSWATTHGLAVKVEFGDSTTSFTLAPTSITDERAGLLEGDEKGRVLGLTGAKESFVLPFAPVVGP